MDIEFHILNGRFNEDGLADRYEQAYKTFKETWESELGEIKGERVVVSSNDFTRQDYIIALYHGETCVALDLMRDLSLKSPAQQEDSWFQPWNKKHLHAFVEQGYDRAMVNSYFTVHKDYRRTVQGSDINVGYLAGALSVLYQLELGCPLMLGMMRNNRSMNALGSSLGGSTVEANIQHNNLPTDLYAFKMEDVVKASLKFPRYVFDIFNSNLTIMKGRAHHERVA